MGSRGIDVLIFDLEDLFDKNPDSLGQCPLCDRPMIAGRSVDEHHLIPRLKKGKKAELCHVVCHRKIHSLFTEAELASEYNTWEKLRAHPDIQSFISWVNKKDPEYVDSSRESNKKRRKRRR